LKIDKLKLIIEYKPMSHHSKEVVLGFYESPKNSLLTKPEYTPSKLGGLPVSIFSFTI
jgi:hypothetical protein